MKKFKQFITENTTLNIDQLEVGKMYQVLTFIDYLGMRRIPETFMNFKDDKSVIIEVVVPNPDNANQEGVPVKVISHTLKEIWSSPDEDFTYLDSEEYAEHEETDGRPPPDHIFLIRDKEHEIQFKEISLANASKEVLAVLGNYLF